jgi:hypothetical protein
MADFANQLSCVRKVQQKRKHDYLITLGVEQATPGNASREEQWQLLDIGLWCDSGRPEDPQSAIAARIAKWDEHLVKEPIKAPASASLGARVEIGELSIIIPRTGLAIADRPFLARTVKPIETRLSV